MVSSASKAVLLMVFSLAFSFLYGQEILPNEVDSVWWEQKVKELNYEEEKEEFKPINRNREAPGLGWLFSPIVTYSFLFIGVVVLLIILYKLYLKNIVDSSQERKERSYQYFEEEDLDDHFYEMDLENLLRSAIETQDWKMAIRIQYLILLKRLIDEKHISWHSDLTNLQISHQLANKENEASFRNVVKIVELFWYGDQKSNESDFIQFSQLITDFSITKGRVVE